SSLLGIFTKEGTFSGVEEGARIGLGFLLRGILGSLGRKEEDGLLNFRGFEGFSFLPRGLFKAGGLQSFSLAGVFRLSKQVDWLVRNPWQAPFGKT
ncbi:hypothetical protein AVEN_220518-1, partial [Araneus ventricosus]